MSTDMPSTTTDVKFASRQVDFHDILVECTLSLARSISRVSGSKTRMNVLLS